MKDTSILIAGDFSPKERIVAIIDKGDIATSFPGVADIVKMSDYSIVNFESTIPTPQSHPIKKVGSHICCKANSVNALKILGFKMVTLANNHFMDYGEEGLQNTIDILRSNSLEYVGAGKNLEQASEYRIVKVNEKRVAVINACEHEFSIATNKTPGCNPLDVVNISYDIKKAKAEADYVLLIIHGGNEHYQLPSPRMKKWYRFFIDQGADAVINHHQHCFSGYEVYNGKPIFYGLGNFCFDSASDIKYRHATYNYGYMVKLNFSDQISFELYPYEQCYNTPGVYLLDAEDRIAFDSRISELNDIIADDDRLNAEYDKMADSRKEFIYRGFRPFTSRILNSLYYRGLIPSFLTKERLMTIKAILDCESHNDVLMSNLKRE